MKMLALACVLLGCGNHSSAGSDAGQPDEPDGPARPDGASDDVTPPQIVSVTPSTDVWIHDRFAIRFSEPVAPATVAPAIELRDPDDRPIAITVTLDGTTAFVRAVHPVAAIGTARLVIGGGITDLAGNALAAQTIELALAPWSKPSLDLGSDVELPALAIAGDDIVVASAVAIEGARRIVVVDGAGTRLGDPLGSGASAPVLAGSAVAWVENQTIEAARWDGSTWIALPSPGAGARPVLAASPTGAIGIAWVDRGDLHAARLVGDAWVGESQIAATIVADPALAMVDDTTPVAAFVDRTGAIDRIRVATLSTPIVQQPPFTLFARPPAGTETHVSLAARGTTLLVGWDEFSGYSLSAHAATSTGTGWTLLPTLDVDVPGDARDTEVALDANGDPIAAWTERIEGAQRGFVARFDGTAWVTIGGDSWAGADRPLGVRLALWHDRVPVIAYRDQTRIDLARFNGPGEPRLGLTTRGSIAGCAVDPATPPAVLSATGCFTITGGKAQPHAGLVPYDLRSELWSDGAIKRRWIGLPDGAALTPQANGSLDAPPGTLIIKEFAIDDPADRTIMETRFLIRTSSGWTGLTYQWRFDGSDADLLPANASPVVTWGTDDHLYPDRATCLRCHNPTVGQSLGLRRDQLARRFDYDGILDDQPRVLAQLGVLPAAPVALPLPSPADPRVPIEQRVRGYIAANCAHCHNPSGECGPIDFRLATPLANTRLCDYLVPGDPASSRVFQLISTRPGGMPAAGSLRTDPMFVDLMRRWIQALPSCP